jgi:uncharacterized membrane protein YccC
MSVNLNNGHRLFSKVRLFSAKPGGQIDRVLPHGVDRGAVISTCFVVLWSMVELPWEIDVGMGVEQCAAILVSKLFLIVLAVLSLRGLALASYAFGFVCLTSIVAIAVEVSSEYTNSRYLALLSSIELVGKLGAFVSVVAQLNAKARRGNANSTI